MTTRWIVKRAWRGATDYVATYYDHELAVEMAAHWNEERCGWGEYYFVITAG